MEKYMPKAAVLAEIERRIKTNKECMLGLRNLDYYQGKVDALNDTISFLDTIELKEVDLEKEINKYISDNFFGSQTLGFFANRTKEEPNDEDIALVAKYFFELGLKSKSSYVGTPNIDDTLKEMGVDPDSKLAKSFKEFYYMALERFNVQKGE